MSPIHLIRGDSVPQSKAAHNINNQACFLVLLQVVPFPGGQRIPEEPRGGDAPGLLWPDLQGLALPPGQPQAEAGPEQLPPGGHPEGPQQVGPLNSIDGFRIRKCCCDFGQSALANALLANALLVSEGLLVLTSAVRMQLQGLK